MQSPPAPRPQKTPASDIERLEQRIAGLETLLNQNVAFGQSMIAAVKQIGERMLAYEQFLGKTDRLEQALTSHITVQSLAQASRLYPKTRTAVFVGRDYFNDNIKYAFTAFLGCAAAKNIACHFVTDNPGQYAQLKAAGLPCLPPDAQDWSDADAKILLGAAVAVIGDNFHPFTKHSPVPYALLQGAKFVQLWHGIPLKEIGLQNIFSASGKNVFMAPLLASAGPYEYLVAPGKAAEAEWRQRFSFRYFAATGYPRTDVFFREPSPTDLINVDTGTLAAVQAARRDGKPVILYTPTFRDHTGPDWFEKLDIESFAAHCRAQGYVLYINLHPFEQGAVEPLRARHPGLNFIAPYTDLYPIVKYADVLITDYSSLAFDFLLLDRPLVFFRPDHAEYMARSRALIKGREAYTPGAITDTIPGLIKAADTAVAAARQPAGDPFKSARETLRRQLFDHCDGLAGERLAALIAEQIDRIVPA